MGRMLLRFALRPHRNNQLKTPPNLFGGWLAPRPAWGFFSAVLPTPVLEGRERIAVPRQLALWECFEDNFSEVSLP